MGFVRDCMDFIHETSIEKKLVDKIIEKITKMKTYKDIENYLFSLRKKLNIKLKKFENDLKEFYESDI